MIRHLHDIYELSMEIHLKMNPLIVLFKPILHKSEYNDAQ